LAGAPSSLILAKLNPPHNRALCVQINRRRILLMTKFDKLMKVYQELMLEFKELDSDLITNILDSWSTSFAQMEQYLEHKQIRKSQMNSGLQQGLKELPDLLSDLPDKEREIALLKLYKVMNKNIPGFY
tara:strand:+ start:76 stop:462 length:387 start_codon:yes stop_codon:yes gene_type:complete